MTLQQDGDIFSDPLPSGLEIPPPWEEAGGRFLRVGGAALVLGAPDTGKSTLCRYLVHRARAAGEPVALVDLDVGQSHLGPPGTLGLSLFPPRRPGDDSLFPEDLYFIGQTSPVGVILEVGVGCRVLADRARARGCSRIVVNTSGYVQGAGALRLKRSQVELLNPGLILALQRERELEPLLRGLGARHLTQPQGDSFTPPPPVGGGWREGDAGAELTSAPTLPRQGEGRNDRENLCGWPLLRLPVSSRAICRTPEERRAYREERFRGYFRQAEPRRLPWAGLGWEGLPFSQGEPLGRERLEQLHRRLGVEVLYGELQGRRLVLLLAEPPREGRLHPAPDRLDSEPVHWLSWPALHWRLLGLLDGRSRTLGLALVAPEPWDPRALSLWTPVAAAELGRVRFLKTGRIRLNLKGQELAHV